MYKFLEKCQDLKKNISFSESKAFYAIIYLAEYFLLAFSNALEKEPFFNTLIQLLHKICH